jgi:hypothetical protein
MIRRLALLSLLTACAFAPDEGEPLDPPPAEYREWFSELQECAGRQADFDQIRWYVADLEANGRYGWTKGWSVYLDYHHQHRKEVVAHESLHVLLNGDGEHQSSLWRKCI